MVAALIQQVQLLATASSTQGTSIPTQAPIEESYYQQGKRQDVKDTPSKHKRSHDHNAGSEAEEGSRESAPMDDDRLTEWGDYLTTPKKWLEAHTRTHP